MSVVDPLSLRPPEPNAPVTQALVESIVDGVYTVDSEGLVVSVNRAAERMLGWEQALLRGRSAHRTFHFQHADGTPHPLEDCPLLGVLRSGQPVQVGSDVFTRADGRMLEVAYSSSPILRDGEVSGAVIVFRDITQARDAQRETARLVGERDRASDEWQRNLLPAALPEIAHAELAVAFRPAGSGALVGGDFYDVIASHTGHLLVLGDVRGKGSGAAAVAAMVRYVLRGAGESSSDLRHLLGLVNRELLAHPASRFCTLVLIHLLELDDGCLQADVVCAGHPRPVLAGHEGSAREVGGTGPLLGVFDDVRIHPETAQIGEGETLVLYSDGLVDVGRRLGRGPFDVRAALDAIDARSCAEIVTRLERAAKVPDVAERPDDVCVLAVRRTEQTDAIVGRVRVEDSAPADPEAVGEVEADFREDNDRLVSGRPATERTVSVTCECGHTACEELIDVPLAIYERVREDDRGFLVLVGHELPHAEHVQEHHDGYLIVRKHGAAGERAKQEADPPLAPRGT